MLRRPGDKHTLQKSIGRATFPEHPMPQQKMSLIPFIHHRRSDLIGDRKLTTFAHLFGVIFPKMSFTSKNGFPLMISPGTSCDL